MSEPIRHRRRRRFIGSPVALWLLTLGVLVVGSLLGLFAIATMGILFANVLMGAN